jgi:hypothetical protein
MVGAGRASWDFANAARQVMNDRPAPAMTSRLSATIRLCGGGS